MSTLVVMIPGDGIGPEVAAAAEKMIRASGASIDWIYAQAGADTAEKTGNPLPVETIDLIDKHKVALKGPTGTPIGGGFRSINVALRQHFELYANFRPAKTMKGLETRFDNVDLITIRENTEGLYSGLEHVVTPGVVESLRIITEKGSERIVRFAFETARLYNRKKVTAVHKANILKLSDGLFLDVARRIASLYPDIEYDESIVDATCMRLVMDPSVYDVLVMENLFGDIVSDLASGLIGGLGMAPSANIGATHAIFEAVHGSAPDIAGKGLANPAAFTLSGALMLRHLGMPVEAERIENAIRTVIAEGSVRTRDTGGTAGTSEFTDAVIEKMELLKG